MSQNKISRRDFLKLLGGGIAVTTASLSGCDSLKSLLGTRSTKGEVSGNLETREHPLSHDRISLWGYSLSRLPHFLDDPENPIHEQRFLDLVEYAYTHGVNYFETSPDFEGGASERAAGKALCRYPRESYFLATRLTSAATVSLERAAAQYRNSLSELRTDHIDYYLLDATGETEETLHRKWVESGILDFLEKERAAGRIRHLGWVFHSSRRLLEELLAMDIRWDFAQIGVNYLEWDHSPQPATGEVYRRLAEAGIPVIATDALSGGNLTQLPEGLVTRLKERSPLCSTASWGIRFAASLPQVLSVVGGTIHKEQLRDNIGTLSPLRPCSDEELAFLEEIARCYREHPHIPCTGCGRCMPCPYGLDIAAIFRHYNQCVNEGEIATSTRDENYRRARRAFLIGYNRRVEKSRQADQCLLCGQCVTKCPRGIKIPAMMVRISRYVEKLKQETL